MSELATGIFVGRAIKSDPSVGQASEHATYVCVLLEGQEGRPGVTLCERADPDALLLDFRNLMRAVGLIERLARLKTTFDPPPGTYPVVRSAASARYERLDDGRIDKFLAFWD